MNTILTTSQTHLVKYLSMILLSQKWSAGCILALKMARMDSPFFLPSQNDRNSVELQFYQKATSNGTHYLTWCCFSFDCCGFISEWGKSMISLMSLGKFMLCEWRLEWVPYVAVVGFVADSKSMMTLRGKVWHDSPSVLTYHIVYN